MTKESKVCCDCAHDSRTIGSDGHVVNHCDVDGHYIGYVTCFEESCCMWCSRKEATDEHITKH